MDKEQDKELAIAIEQVADKERKEQGNKVDPALADELEQEVYGE